MPDIATLADFIVHAPLYSRRLLKIRFSTFKNPVPPYEDLHTIIYADSVQRHCSSVSCDKVMTFDKGFSDQDRLTLHSNVPYICWFYCRHCHEGFSVWISWTLVDGQVALEKWGAMPRPDIALPAGLRTALDKYSDFWRRGIGLRHHGAGIGALAYFRRIVEGTTNDLLELLAKAMETLKDPDEDIAAVRKMIQEKARFEDKIREAATVLPARYRPGDANPLKTIFDIVSDGLHARTDPECCDVVDALSESMAFLFSRLNEDIRAQSAFTDAVKKLEALRRRQGD